MPPPTPTSPKTQMKLSRSARDALPVLGERGEVGLVVGAHREAREPRGDLVRDGDAPTSRGSERAGASPSAPRRAPGARRRRRPGRDPRSAMASSACSAIRASRFSTGPGARAAVVGVDALLVPDRAGQVLDADREVVHVDLEPDRDDPVAELERLRRPADAARVVVLARLPEQVELDQLADEARDRAARQPGLGGDAGAGARLAGRRSAAGRRRGWPDARSSGRHARSRLARARSSCARLRLGGMSQSTRSRCRQPGVGFCMAIAQTKRLQVGDVNGASSPRAAAADAAPRRLPRVIADAHLDLLLELGYRELRFGERGTFAQHVAAAARGRRRRPPGLPRLRRARAPAGGDAARGARPGDLPPPGRARERRARRAGAVGSRPRRASSAGSGSG